MLSRWTLTELSEAFAGTRFQPFPPAADRVAWQARLTGPFAVELATGRATQPTLPAGPTAAEWAAYAATGDRLAFETPYLNRRLFLSHAALAAAAGDPVAAGDVVSAVRAILAEPAWWLPAHDRMRPDQVHGGGARPDPAHPVVDLFAADTAALLAETTTLHGAEWAQAAPGLREQVSAAIARRVVEPVLALDWWWLHGTNNWTPWCCAMTFLAAAHLETDAAVLARLAERCLRACDGYLAAVPADGGCEEGLMYWAVSPPLLALLLETLRERSGGRCNAWDEPKLAAMAAFLPRLHLGGGTFPWFADCRPVPAPRRGLCRRFATRTGVGDLAGILVETGRGPWSDVQAAARTGAPLVYWLRDLWWPEGATGPVEPAEDDGWPETQLWVARDARSGLAVAVKGGSTGASHGHLDVGQFVIHRHGEPLLVDAGMGGYHADVFGAERHAQPWIRAADHAVPIIGAIAQVFGRDHAARIVEQGRAGDCTRVVLDLTGAYPRGTDLLSVQRAVMLDRARSRVLVTDTIRSRTPQPVALNLWAVVAPRVESVGCLRLGERAPVRLCHDATQLELLAIEPVAINDPWLRRGWGERLYRLRFRTAPATHVEYQLEILV